MYNVLPLAAVKSGRSDTVTSDDMKEDSFDGCNTCSSTDNDSITPAVLLEIDAFSNAVGLINRN